MRYENLQIKNTMAQNRPLPALHHMQHHPAPPQQSRLSELFEAVKHEVEQVQKESKMYKTYVDDLEKKLSLQINEMSVFQQSLYDLERIHQQMKQQYEDEILRKPRLILGLRSMLDQKPRKPLPDGPPPVLAASRTLTTGAFGSLVGLDKRRESDAHNSRAMPHIASIRHNNKPGAGVTQMDVDRPVSSILIILARFTQPTP